MKKLSESTMTQIAFFTIMANIVVWLYLSIDALLNHSVHSELALFIDIIEIFIFLLLLYYQLHFFFIASIQINDAIHIQSECKNEYSDIEKKIKELKNEDKKICEKKMTETRQEIERNHREILKAHWINRFLLITTILTFLTYHLALFSISYSYFYNLNSAESFFKLTNLISSQFYSGVLTSSSLFLTISISFFILIYEPTKQQIKEISSYFSASFLYIFSSLFFSIIGLSLSEWLLMNNPFPVQNSIFLVTLIDIFLGFILIFIAVFKAYTYRLKLD